MSPEQFQGGAPAQRWDLWPLAVIAYEMLAGTGPFRGETRAEYTQAVLAGRVAPLSEHAGPAAARWDCFFKHALAVEPLRRPATAGELLERFQKTGL